MDCSLPGSSIYGIFQARVLEWVAIAFSTIKGYSTTNRQVIRITLIIRKQCESYLKKKKFCWDFLGDPVVKTPHFQCRGGRFDPWSGN